MMEYFSRWVPLDLVDDDLQKGNDAPTSAKIGGVLSSEALDQQGERISQEGIDWSYFLSKGWFNYEHQQGPDNVIGEPLRVFRDGDKTRVEGILYLSKPKAREIYETAQAIRKAGSSRKLGFSIEGGAKARDPKNPKNVLKSRILNVAITAHPVNAEAHLDILKALDAGYQTVSSGGGAYGPLMPQSLQGGVDVDTIDSVSPWSDEDIGGALRAVFPSVNPGMIRDKAKKIHEALCKGLSLEEIEDSLFQAFPHAPVSVVESAARALSGVSHE